MKYLLSALFIIIETFTPTVKYIGGHNITQAKKLEEYSEDNNPIREGEGGPTLPSTSIPHRLLKGKQIMQSLMMGHMD